jgi:hypothetical protein
MKARRSIFGLAVVLVAISLSAFTTHVQEAKNAKKFGTYYWFPLDPASGVPQTSGTLVYLSYDPSNCSFLGMGGYCIGAFTGYTQSQWGYNAAGTEVTAHFYPQ